MPAGCLNVIYHKPSDAADITNALIEHPAIKKINFTGSTAVGSIIASKAGKELKPVLMELGGKASAIVCADADLEKAAFQCALGALAHSGQICMSTERIVVHKSIVEPFSQELKKAIEKIYPGDGESPILVATPAVEKNKKLMHDAVSKGAKVLYGDLAAKDSNAYRMRPIVITDVSKDMDIYYTESFGPTVSLLTVDSDEQAVELANDTEYGLSGAIFTSNLGRGIKLARQIDAGAVHINQMSVHDEPCLPHGGVKKSGWGRFNSNNGLDECEFCSPFPLIFFIFVFSFCVEKWYMLTLSLVQSSRSRRLHSQTRFKDLYCIISRLFECYFITHEGKKKKKRKKKGGRADVEEEVR